MNPNQDKNRDENDRSSGEPQPEWKTSPADFTPDPSGSKAPPFQVPKPELHPELLNPQNPPTQPQDAAQPQDGPPPLIDPFAREREREQAARKKRSQRRTVVVGLGVTALLAGTITAIVASNADEPDYAQVCFDEATGERVEDTQCNSSAGRGGGLYAWYFYSRGANVPPVGQNRTSYPNFTRSIPEGAKASTGYSTKGGTVSRGGFGSSSKGGSTGG
ncbi:Tat pathway signal protein [Arthrobacter sp. R1-13]